MRIEGCRSGVCIQTQKWRTGQKTLAMFVYFARQTQHIHEVGKLLRYILFSPYPTPQKKPKLHKKKKLTPNSVKQSQYIRAQDHLTLELSQVSVMAPGSSISTSQSCSHTYPPRSAEWSISPSGAHIRSNGGDRGYLNPWQPGHNSINLFSVKVFDSLASLQKKKGAAHPNSFIMEVWPWQHSPC